jgi:hypothetical protein
MDFKVTIQNISTVGPQSGWISMGVPDSVASQYDGKNFIAKTEDGRAFKMRMRGKELFVNADMHGNETITVAAIPDDQPAEPFMFSDWVTDEPAKVVPSFSIMTEDGLRKDSIPMVFWDGSLAKPRAFFQFLNSNDARLRVYIKTEIPDASLHIEGWLDVYSGQDAVPMVIRCSYGTVASERVLNKRFGSLSMYTGEKPVVDFRKQKGLRETIFRTDIGLWETEIASPRAWWKARVIEVFGAILCLPSYDKLSEVLKIPENAKRFASLQAREQAPMAGIVQLWDNNFLATKTVPQNPIGETNFVRTAYSQLLNRVNTFGDEYNARAYAQPPNSGQTGDQPDFGISRGELVVTSDQPWALWDYRFSVQAWMLRPYAHKETDGSPVTAGRHPNTKLYNLAIDTRFGSDFLGFPNPMPYSEFWTGSDNQHRSDNLLFAMYALTRDPSIEATIRDLLQCQLMEVKTWELYGPPIGSIGSPRGWGRPLLSMAHAHSLGFTEATAYMNEMVNIMYNGASMMALPQTERHTVRTLSNNGGKYGWVDAQGQPIRAWVCWEEAIAAIGLWAVYRATKNEKAKYLAGEIGKTIAKHAFFKAQDNKWYACYSVRWDTQNPGIPLPDSAYRLTARPEDNKDVFVYGMQQWMLPALRIFLRLETDGNNPDIQRAVEIINFFGPMPRSYNDAAWWAI